MAGFDGFPQGSLTFLSRLRENNDRTWFNAHKQDYESLVREPALAFIAAMEPRLSKLSSHFLAIPKKTGGSLMRVYRDTRYTHDKSPYKTNIGIQFRHQLGKDVHAPGFYVHIEPGSCFIGAGIWRPESKVLGRIRDFLTDNPAGWKRALNHRPFHRHFQLVGDSLVRPPRGYPADHELLSDLKRKDFIACKNFDEREITSPDFAVMVGEDFAKTTPFMRYLCAAVGVPY
ncbi:MAG: DUF2461 domain-containing protein [Gammaproteobacteria bacterium]|nr:DUF2461 domain-containing protein [Gammaproteobacteria bacterium]